jgi:NAD(P)-dependent dehydrogenase (short-subunit alcohol dehydrogenase family)
MDTGSSTAGVIPMNRIWLVTGAARGIGFEIAKAALADGDRVIAAGRNPASLQAAFARYGENVLAVTMDVGDAAQVRAGVARAIGHFGRIDVLVNNAGYGQLGMFEEIDDAAIAQQFATNVFGLMQVTRAVLPAMRAQRSGQIFNISSVGGAVGYTGASIYCASKFALEGFSESLASEIAAFGIRLTIVEPGFTRSDFLDASSVRYGEHPIADYVDMAAQHRATYEAHNHRQSGDPAKLAAALLTVLASEHPPLRLATGSDSFGLIEQRLASSQAELQQWRALSVSVDGVAAA